MQQNKLQAQPSPASVAPFEPTADESAAPNYPKDLYDEAHIENGHRDFNDRLRAARSPDPKPVVVPERPVALVKQTDLEMQAGRDRVTHFENIEVERQKIATRTPEKWEGKSAAVFRPGDFSEYKPGFKALPQTPSKDTLAQPRR